MTARGSYSMQLTALRSVDSFTAARKEFMAISRSTGDERSPIAPEDYYQSTKYEGEKVVQEYLNNKAQCSDAPPYGDLWAR